MTRVLSALLLVTAACHADADDADDAADEDTTSECSSGGSSDGSSAGASSSGAEPEHVCEIGDARPCDCPDGSSGSEVCIDVTGLYSECGCAVDPDVYEPPVPPMPTYCGELECAAMTEENTEVAAKPCCTAEESCGATSSFLFGDACIERFGDPGDLEDAGCPDESPVFLDLEGCCRTDGMCGLSVDFINNWDVGCIERTAMMQLLNDGSADRQFLANFFLLGSVLVDFAPIECG